MLTIITGPQGSGKTERLRELAKQEQVMRSATKLEEHLKGNIQPGTYYYEEVVFSNLKVTTIIQLGGVAMSNDLHIIFTTQAPPAIIRRFVPEAIIIDLYR